MAPYYSIQTNHHANEQQNDSSSHTVHNILPSIFETAADTTVSPLQTATTAVATAGTGFSPSAPGTSGADPQRRGAFTPEELQKLVSLIVPALLDCWLELSPAEYTFIGSADSNVQAMEIILNIIRLLFTELHKRLAAVIVSAHQRDMDTITALQRMLKTFQGSFVKYVLPYFPFQLLSAQDAKVWVHIVSITMW
jgi:hypothetical protein